MFSPACWPILCRFVAQTKAGPGAGVPYKMQFAINQCGAPKILWAAFRAAIDKLRGVHGTFYKIAGDEVYGLDGFFGHDIEEYAEMGIRIPADPDGVCNKVFQETGVVSMIVDANALAQEILGKCDALRDWPDETLSRLIGDNPAGQVRQLTPFILIREVPQEEAAELEPGARGDRRPRRRGALIVSRSLARTWSPPRPGLFVRGYFPLDKTELRYILNIPTVCI